VRLKVELEHEKRRRNHKEEYEAIAKIINRFPTRSETQRQLIALEGEIAGLMEQQKNIESVTQKRKKQFALLFDCIDDLQRALRADEEEEEARTEGTGKRKRLTTEDDGKGKSIDESETARKRVRGVEVEDVSNEEPNKDMEPGEITKDTTTPS